MNQDDFRQVLASGERSYGGKRHLTELDLAETKKLAKKPKHKSKRPKNAAAEDAQAEQTMKTKANSYRDRAAERRRGGTGDMVDAEEFKHLDAEQSKFLGGDLEHTHLVKGLDYALLAQLKREKEKLQRATEVEKQKQSERVYEVKDTGRLTFKSRMGRLVYFHACQSTPETVGRLQKSELFLPGRMDYTFNLSTEEVESIPVSVQRSKEDCPEPDEVVCGILDEALIDRVKELMTSKKIGGKKLRKKKKAEHHRVVEEEKKEVEERAAPAAPSADVEMAEDDDDEDIFPDVGEYVPMDQRVDDGAADAAKKEAVKSGYFSNLSAAITEKEESERKKEEEAEHAWKDALQKAMEKQKKLELEEARKAKETKMTGAADDYAEYQGYAAFDSDGEDDEETRRRRKAAGLTDRNADPEAQKEEKERRKKQKQSSKIANDLEKINKLMEEKSPK